MIQTWIGQAATALSGAYEASRQAILAADVAHFDERGVRVGGRTLWLHVAGTAGHAFYTIHPKRGGEAMAATGLLPVFEGVAVHDHWLPYFGFGQATHALCNTHLLRELRYFEEATDGHRWPVELREVLVEAKRAALRACRRSTRTGWRTCSPGTTKEWPGGWRGSPNAPRNPDARGTPGRLR